MRSMIAGFASVVAIGLALPVEAADLSGPMPPPPAPIWSGVYLGANLGYAAGDDEAREINGPRNYIANFDGVVGGISIGWQRQRQSWVTGLELEAGYLGLGSTVQRDVTGGFITSGADLGAYAALSGRLGYLIAPSWLVFARAGVVAADLNARTRQTCTGPNLCGGAQSTPVSSADASSPTWGLLLGAGVEHQLAGRWTGRLEYQFMDFRDELALPAVDGPGWHHDINVHAVKFGLSYRF
jgi:outer membrane immunogenic protein